MKNQLSKGHGEQIISSDEIPYQLLPDALKELNSSLSGHYYKACFSLKSFSLPHVIRSPNFKCLIDVAPHSLVQAIHGFKLTIDRSLNVVFMPQILQSEESYYIPQLGKHSLFQNVIYSDTSLLDGSNIQHNRFHVISNDPHNNFATQNTAKLN